MIRALYTATSGMLVEAHRVDVASKNLFHAQTPGYKVVRVLRSARTPTPAALPSDVQTLRAGEYVDPSAGALRFTGKRLDLALEGAGFFEVQTPGGPAVTRDGRFQLRQDKVLADFSGNLLLREEDDEPLRFPKDSEWDAAVEVDEDGTVTVDGEEIGRLRLRHYPDYRGLQPAGGALFYPTGAVAAEPCEARVVQHALEDANSSVIAEMTETIQVSRAFEAYQKAIQTVMDDITGEAVRRLGRVA